MRSLFGDVATNAYKKKISSLEEELNQAEMDICRYKEEVDRQDALSREVDRMSSMMIGVQDFLQNQNVLDDSVRGGESGAISSVSR